MPAAEKGAACERTLRPGRTILRPGYLIRSAASLPGYRQDVELRQLEAFVAVATELHFGRAAERLHLAAPTLSELIRRLERELGTPLFTRTTRQVAITSAGAELLTRSKVILDEIAAAKAAMRRVAGGEAGTVRLGITPPAAPVLAPHLIRLFAAEAPQVTVELQRMWLPDLLDAVVTGDIDVAPTCGLSARAGSRSAASTMHLATPRPPLRAQSAPPRRPQIARADRRRCANTAQRCDGRDELVAIAITELARSRGP